MAAGSKTSPAPIVFGGFILFLIICVAAYVALGPGDEEAPAATTAYPGDPVSGNPVTSGSGLTYYDLKVGDGATPTPTSDVRVHYTGWLLNGSKFDSSVDRNEPFEFKLTGGVIDGWLEGVRTMKVGGKRKLIIPPHLGYGQQSKPKIPPGSTLVSDVELLDILN